MSRNNNNQAHLPASAGGGSASTTTNGSPKGSPVQGHNTKSFKGKGGYKGSNPHPQDNRGGGGSAPRPAGQQQRTHQNLFVACLPKGLTNPELLSIFAPFGATSAAVMMDVTTGVSKGYGFATFSSEEAGKSALDALNHRNVTAGEHTFVITVSPSKHDSKSAIEESPYVYFRNVPSVFAESTIRDVFARYGRVIQHTMRQDGEKESLLVMVEYATTEEAKKAINECHGKILFPQVSQIPVMAKFADANVTKALQQTSRRPTHPFPKHSSNNNPTGSPVLVKHTHGRNSPNIGLPSNQRHPGSPNMAVPAPKSQQQQQGGGTAPIAIHHREGSNAGFPTTGGSHPQGGGAEYGSVRSWDNTPVHSPDMTPRQSFHGGDAEGASYHSTGERNPSYHSTGGSYSNNINAAGGGVLPAPPAHTGTLPMPTHATPVYGSHPRSIGNSQHDDHYGGSSHPHDASGSYSNSLPSYIQQDDGYGGGGGHSHSMGNIHGGSSYHENADPHGSGPMLDGQDVARMPTHHAGGASHGHSAGSSLNARDVPSGATFRHDPYSQHGYSMTSDY